MLTLAAEHVDIGRFAPVHPYLPGVSVAAVTGVDTTKVEQVS